MKKSGSLTSSQGLGDSDSDSKEQTKWLEREAVKGDIAPTLRSESHGNNPIIMVSDASGATISISTPTKSTPQDSGKPTITQVTLGESTQREYPTMISFVQDFHAKPSLLRARGKVSRTLVDRYSSRYSELRGLKDLA